jgi:hypothetical protein
MARYHAALPVSDRERRLVGHLAGPDHRRSGPARGGYAPLAFPAVNRDCMERLHGRTGRLTR